MSDREKLENDYNEQFNKKFSVSFMQGSWSTAEDAASKMFQIAGDLQDREKQIHAVKCIADVLIQQQLFDQALKRYESLKILFNCDISNLVSECEQRRVKKSYELLEAARRARGWQAWTIVEQEAREALHKSLSYMDTPSIKLARYLIALSWDMQDKFTEALKWYELARDTDRENPTMYDEFTGRTINFQYELDSCKARQWRKQSFLKMFPSEVVTERVKQLCRELKVENSMSYKPSELNLDVFSNFFKEQLANHPLAEDERMSEVWFKSLAIDVATNWLPTYIRKADQSGMAIFSEKKIAKTTNQKGVEVRGNALSQALNSQDSIIKLRKILSDFQSKLPARPKAHSIDSAQKLYPALASASAPPDSSQKRLSAPQQLFYLNNTPQSGQFTPSTSPQFFQSAANSPLANPEHIKPSEPNTNYQPQLNPLPSELSQGPNQ